MPEHDPHPRAEHAADLSTKVRESLIMEETRELSGYFQEFDDARLADDEQAARAAHEQITRRMSVLAQLTGARPKDLATALLGVHLCAIRANNPDRFVRLSQTEGF